MLMEIIGKKGTNSYTFFIRYKKCPNDDFEWYYGYDVLKDIFVNHFDENASISFKNNNYLLCFLNNMF